jgi:hypothetical protein
VLYLVKQIFCIYQLILYWILILSNELAFYFDLMQITACFLNLRSKIKLHKYQYTGWCYQKNLTCTQCRMEPRRFWWNHPDELFLDFGVVCEKKNKANKVQNDIFQVLKVNNCQLRLA